MLNDAEYDLKNYTQIKRCYLLRLKRLKAEADDTLQYLHNYCSSHMKAESKLACSIDVFFPYTNVFQILSMLAGYKELARF